jgi:hypothetical protein
MKFWDTGTEIKKTDAFDFERNKRELIENLDYLFAMSVEEQTLYKKWVEWNQDLHASMMRLPVLQSYYDILWQPTDINNKELTIKEINALEPYVEIIDFEFPDSNQLSPLD